MQYLPPSTSFSRKILIHRQRRHRQRQPRYTNASRSCNQSTRRCRVKRDLLYMNSNGEWEKLTPRKTFWSMYYLNSFPVGDIFFEKKFRTRFRIPYHYFKELLSDIKNNPLFKRWQHKRVDKPIVFGLLLLGALRYLGRGWTFDDLEESTAISQYVHRDFLHIFVKYGQEYLYPKHVIYPTRSADMAMYSREYEQAGFHGALGSMDACHIVIEKCSHQLKQNHLGGKSKLTCRSYNLTCNHQRQSSIQLQVIQHVGMIKLSFYMINLQLD